jgi:hypothetical protein
VEEGAFILAYVEEKPLLQTQQVEMGQIPTNQLSPVPSPHFATMDWCTLGEETRILAADSPQPLPSQASWSHTLDLGSFQAHWFASLSSENSAEKPQRPLA